MPQEEITWAEIKELFKETDEKFKETDDIFKETDVRFKETDVKINKIVNSIDELKKQINKTESMFTSQWGKLIESLVSGDLVRLLNERGIPVNYITERMRGSTNGHNYEFDIIAVNGPMVVIVEVKTTLKPKHVKAFIQKLRKFNELISLYRDKKVLGGMAYLRADAGSENMVQNRGMFAIRATGDSASIINPMNFTPREF